jgi:hypothetical protein
MKTKATRRRVSPPLPLNQETSFWLEQLAAERARETGRRVNPLQIAAWMLDQIRIEDEQAEGLPIKH